MTRKNAINNACLFLDTVPNKNIPTDFCIFILSVPQVHSGTEFETSSDTDQIKLCYFTTITGCGEKKNKKQQNKQPLNLELHLSPALPSRTAFSRTDL